MNVEAIVAMEKTPVNPSLLPSPYHRSKKHKAADQMKFALKLILFGKL